MKKSIIFVLIFVFSLFFNAENTQAKNPVDREQIVYSYIKQQWWQKEFNDPFLLEFINKAVQNNYDIKIAHLKTEETIQLKNLTRSKELPSIGIGVIPALYKLPSLSNSEGLISLPIYANYELDIFAKNRDKTKSKDKIIETAIQNERASYISIVCAVASTYFNIIKLDKLIEIQEKIFNARNEIYNLMDISNKEGLISTSDAVNAHKSLIKAESEMLELKKNREKLLNMLAALIGETSEQSLNYSHISYDNLVINDNIPDYISSDVIENRPDYIIAVKMIEKAGIDVRIAKKEFLPSFDILGLLSFNSTKYLSKLNWNNSLGILGEGTFLSLFSGGAKIANFKLNKNRYYQALENYQNTIIKSIQEINDQLCSLKADYQKYLKTLERCKDEEQSLYFDNLKYKEGVISKLDLLQKQESLLTTEKILVNDKTSYFINRIGIFKAAIQ